MLFAQRSVENLGLANAAWDKSCGGNGETRVSKPWLPPEPIQAVPSAISFGCATFRVAVGCAEEVLKRGFVCVIWEEDLLFQQMSTSILRSLQAGCSLGCDGA